MLEVVAGRGPLIVELKSGKRNDELCKKTLDILYGYDGVYCVESFDPKIVFWFKLYAPHIVRGQLAMQAECYKKDLMGGFGPFLMSNCCFNFITRPHFIAYRVGKKAPLVRLAELLGAIKVGWTIHAPEEEKGYDIPIFEWYRA